MESAEQDQRSRQLLLRRAAARVLDMLTVFFAMWLLGVLQVLFFLRPLRDRLDPEPWGEAFAPLVLYLIFYAAYEVLFTAHNQGQTPGKDHLNLRVLQTADGQVPSPGRVAVRWAPLGAAVLVPPPVFGSASAIVLGLPLLAGAAALHDRLAGTTVVEWDRDEEERAGEPERDPDEEAADRARYGPAMWGLGRGLLAPRPRRGDRGPAGRRDD